MSCLCFLLIKGEFSGPGNFSDLYVCIYTSFSRSVRNKGLLRCLTHIHVGRHEKRGLIFMVMFLPIIIFRICTTSAASFPTDERLSSIIQLRWLAALLYRLVYVILPSGGTGIIIEWDQTCSITFRTEKNISSDHSSLPLSPSSLYEMVFPPMIYPSHSLVIKYKKESELQNGKSSSLFCTAA